MAALGRRRTGGRHLAARRAGVDASGTFRAASRRGDLLGDHARARARRVRLSGPRRYGRTDLRDPRIRAQLLLRAVLVPPRSTHRPAAAGLTRAGPASGIRARPRPREHATTAR